MNGFGAAVWAEFLKARRSRVPWAIAAGFSLVPVIGGLFMVILKDPESARRLGLLGAKAQLAGTADWPTFFSLLIQALAVGGAVLFAFLTAWIFGREFSDRTVRGLLAIQTPRGAIVVAKALVVAALGATVSFWVLALGLAIGTVVGLPGWSADLATDVSSQVIVVAVMTIGLQSTTAFVASAGRGYLPALGWAVLTVSAAQVLALLGWGAWFPWAVPALVSGMAGPEGEVVTAGSYAIVGVAALGGSGRHPQVVGPRRPDRLVPRCIPGDRVGPPRYLFDPCHP